MWARSASELDGFSLYVICMSGLDHRRGGCCVLVVHDDEFRSYHPRQKGETLLLKPLNKGEPLRIH